MIMKIDKRKLLGFIIGILLFSAFVTSLSFAYYKWQSDNTDVGFVISDSYFYCESEIEMVTNSLAPVLDYRNGSVQKFKVNNIGKQDTTFSVSLNITKIDSPLKSTSFKYKLVVDTTGGSNNCVTSSSCSEVENGSGDFSNVKVGMNTLVSSVSLPNNSRYEYYLFMYIDGSVENDVAMQGSEMTSTLGVCEVVAYLDANGGSVSPDFIKLVAGTEKYPTIPTPTRSNSVVTYNYNNATGGNSIASDTVSYTFNGWYKDTDTSYTNKIVEGSNLTDTTNHTLKARWTASKSVTLPTPTRTGYTFGGWYSDSSFNNKVGNAGATYNPSKSITLYAKWTANTYTVTYYNGGTNLGTSNHTYGTSKALTTWSSLGGTITNSSYGWSFAGWSTSNANTTRTYTDGASVNNLTSTSGGNINLYAVYKRTITFKHGASAGTSSTTTQYWNPYGTTNGTHIAAVTSPSLTAITNWTAAGFRNDTTAGEKEYNAGSSIYPAVAESATLYGVYSRTIKFYSGASKATTDGTRTQYLNSNSNNVSAITSYTPATITNWTTLGYRDDTTAGAKEYSSNTSISPTYTTGNSMYAVYSRTLTISYNGNSNTGGSTSNTTKTVYLNTNSNTTSSQEVTLASNGFTKTGYTFSKWAAGSTSGTQYAAGSAYTAGVAYNASTFGTTMYAIWTANGYTVTYYNGSNKLGSSNHTYGTSKALTTWSSLGGSVTNSSYGWSFAGWSTSNANTTRTYTDGASVNNLTSTSGGNINLYAVYKRTITFKHGASAGTSSTTTQYWNPYGTTNGTHIAAVTSPSLTAITNWTAAGFRNDTTAGAKEYNAGSSIYPAVAESATLYGTYSRTITFYSGASKATTDGTRTQYLNSYNNTVSSITSYTPATITNWTTLGYRDDTTAGAKEYSSNTSISPAYTTGNSMYAVYSRTLTISYNGNGNTGGSTSNTTKTIYLNTNSTTTSSQEVTLASNGFTKTGHTFSKWSAGSTSGTQYAAGSTYTAGVAYNTSTFGTTMYAIWTANSYTITFNVNSGAAWTSSTCTGTGITFTSSSSTCTKSVTYASTYGTLPTPNRTGYTFDGWYTASSGGTKVTSSSTVSITTNQTLYAHWTANKYTVTYDYSTNGGTSATKTTASVAYGSSVDLTPTATKSGWTFVGWNTNKNATSKLNSLTMGTSNITLYAIYKKTGQVTFNLNGNTSFTYGGTKYTSTTSFNLCTMYNTATTCTASVTMPKIEASSNTPTVIGWSNAAGTHTATYTSGQSNVTLTSGTTWYAQTKKDKVTLNASFNANGATLSSTTAQSCTLAITYNGTAQDTSCTVTAPTITRSGYTIVGFNTSASSTSNNSSYSSSTGKITLTGSNTGATWYAITYKKLTATFYYYNSGIKNTSATCNMYNTATSCSATVPTSTFSSTTAQYGGSYVGYGSVNTMGTSTASTVSISQNTNYYVSYRKNVTEYYKNTSRTIYRNAYFTSTSAMSTVLSTSNTGTSNLSTASYTKDSITWSWYGYATSSSTSTRSYSTVANAATSTTTALYTLYSRSVTATFYYYNGSAQATTTASGTQLANYQASVVSNGSISIPSAVTSSTGPNNISYTGLSTSAGSTTTTTTINTSQTKYYAIYIANYTASFTKENSNVSSIGSTSLSCSSKATTNGTTYSSTACSITLPSITPASGYIALGWYNSSGTLVGQAGSSINITSNQSYTAKAKSLTASEFSYDNTETGVDCTDVQCMIDKLDENAGG